MLGSCSKKEPKKEDKPSPPKVVNPIQANPIKTGPKRTVYIKTFRFEGRDYLTVEECIELGIVTVGMTMDECNESVKGEFELHTKLEDDWAIYNYGDMRIYFKEDVVHTITDLQISRIMKAAELIKKNKHI